MPKYHVTLSSGRDFIMEHPGNEYDIAYEAYDEACLMDDYLVDIDIFKRAGHHNPPLFL